MEELQGHEVVEELQGGGGDEGDQVDELECRALLEQVE